jgi:uncharacterized protein (TIGR02145 family)
MRCLLIFQFIFLLSLVTIAQTPCPSASISGILKYDNAPGTPLKASMIFLKTTSGLIIDSCITSQNGTYRFCDVQNGNFKLAVKTDIPWGGVNATDALMTLQHFVHVITLTGLRFKAGDVNANSYINTADALLIGKRFVHIFSSFPAGDWVFEEPQVIISDTSGHTIDIKSLCMGDVDGSYIMPCYPPVSIANGGPHQTNITGNADTLSANSPAAWETGTWTIISGLGGTIGDIHNPAAVFTGYPFQTYTLEWKIKNDCDSTTDNIDITFHLAQQNLSCPGLVSFVYGGQSYNTVQIGSQCWMKENLNVGTMVISDNTGVYHSNCSDNSIIEKYCYDNDPVNCTIYGGLYDWDEMMQYSTTPGVQGICPDDWHLPTEVEWFTMVHYLDSNIQNEYTYQNIIYCLIGAASSVGVKLKETETAHWLSPNTWASNESGFTALAGGYRHEYGGFESKLEKAEFWCSTWRVFEGYDAYRWTLQYNVPGIFLDGPVNHFGLSVRCIKNCYK